jgi:hypothetical protein
LQIVGVLIDANRRLAGYDSNGTPVYASTIPVHLAKPGEPMCGRCGSVQQDLELCPECGNDGVNTICETADRTPYEGQ